MILFTSGTSGEPKGALHTENTLYASACSVSQAHDFGPSDVRFTPHALMHTVGQDTARSAVIAVPAWSCSTPGPVGAACRSWLTARPPDWWPHRVSSTTCSRQPKECPSICRRCARCAAWAQPLPRRSSKPCLLLRGPLLGGWGTAEIGICTVTRSDDPPNWAAHSDGRPINGIEIDIRSDTEITDQRPGACSSAAVRSAWPPRDAIREAEHHRRTRRRLV